MEEHCIIGDSTLLSKGLGFYLKNFESTNVSLLGSEEIDQIHKVNLVNMDFLWIDLPREIKKALVCCQKVLQLYPNLNVLVFCDNNDPVVIKSFLKVGVKGYLLPYCNIKNINNAIRQIDKGRVFIDPDLSQILTNSLLEIGPQKSKSASLTKREKQILQLIIEEYTTQEIANKLFISFCTVETHRLHLIQKMGVRNTAGLVREALSRNIYQKSMNSLTF